MLDPKLIDTNIRSLVLAMNKPEIGLKTHFSCGGHFEREAGPYVIFGAHENLVVAIAERVMEASDTAKLNYYWHVTGVFLTTVNARKITDGLCLLFRLDIGNFNHKYHYNRKLGGSL